MALRRETAAKLFAKIEKPEEPTADNVKALAEVISYANEGKFADAFRKCLKAYGEKANKPADEVSGVNGALKVLVRNRVISVDQLVK